MVISNDSHEININEELSQRSHVLEAVNEGDINQQERGRKVDNICEDKDTVKDYGIVSKEWICSRYVLHESAKSQQRSESINTP